MQSTVLKQIFYEYHPLIHAKTLVPLVQIYCSLFDISKVLWLIVDLKNLGVEFQTKRNDVFFVSPAEIW